MEWLLSVSDHIVELVPSWQTFPDGSTLEVRIIYPRTSHFTMILYMGLFISPSPLHPLLASGVKCVHHPKWIANYEAFCQCFNAGDGEPASLRSSPKSPSFAQVGYHAAGMFTDQNSTQYFASPVKKH